MDVWAVRQSAMEDAAASEEQQQAPGSLEGAAGEDMCVVRVLLVNESHFQVESAPTSTVRELKERILAQRPAQLVELLQKTEQPFPESTAEIRLLMLGKFLVDTDTLHSCGFKVGPGEQTTVHCSIKSAAQVHAKSKPKDQAACCVIS
ncbi:hypothetical protein FVE85_0802 [Porphyridium purpureum]|uniref:Ubiquitin-like domain-containing protein n=1 Tax=Porphyridium purpureum TaxID=35688 RepID=A0A5J4Z2D5_PORPP|nr:hypothetical protein FVE85_0802 [Porphyridium purpureum]|eukprot:POR6411..scf208_2